jgi:hypothetical protein
VFNVGADLPYTVEHLAHVVGRAMGLENVRARSCMRARVCVVRIRVRSPFCSGRPVVLNRVLVASARVVQHATISRSAKARARSVVRSIGRRSVAKRAVLQTRLSRPMTGQTMLSMCTQTGGRWAMRLSSLPRARKWCMRRAITRRCLSIHCAAGQVTHVVCCMPCVQGGCEPRGLQGCAVQTLWDRYGLHCSTPVCRKARGLVLQWRACVRTYIAQPALLNTATGVLLNAPSGCSRTAQHSIAYAVGANAAAGGQRLRICCLSCTQAYTVGSAGLAHIGAVLLLPAATADLARRRYGAASVFLFQEL